MAFESFDGEIFYCSKDLAEVNGLAAQVRDNFERIWVCTHSSNVHDEFGLGITNEWGGKLKGDLKERVEEFVKKISN